MVNPQSKNPSVFLHEGYIYNLAGVPPRGMVLPHTLKIVKIDKLKNTVVVQDGNGIELTWEWTATKFGYYELDDVESLKSIKSKYSEKE